MLEKNLKRLFYLVIAVCLLAAAAVAVVKAQPAAKTKNPPSAGKSSDCK